MPYEYRRMTTEERAEVVALRRERGYPLHAPPHPFRNAGWYLITAANFQHKRIMAGESRRDVFESCLLNALKTHDVEIGGWVILPNLYHVLLGVASLNVLSAALQKMHGVTSRQWNLEDDTVGRQVWYKFSDRFIRDEAHYWRALNYLHYNPLKHRCTQDVYDWRWSSIDLYLQKNGRDWLRGQWVKYPVQDFGAGWDDDT